MHADLTDRIENWSRAMALNRGQGRAMSLEGLYRSPQRWDAPAVGFRGFLVIADAYAVEVAWGSLELRQRMLLRGHHCRRLAPAQVCRMTARVTGQHCKRRDFDRLLKEATAALELALERDAEINRERLREWARKTLALEAA